MDVFDGQKQSKQDAEDSSFAHLVGHLCLDGACARGCIVRESSLMVAPADKQKRMRDLLLESLLLLVLAVVNVLLSQFVRLIPLSSGICRVFESLG